MWVYFLQFGRVDEVVLKRGTALVRFADVFGLCRALQRRRHHIGGKQVHVKKWVGSLDNTDDGNGMQWSSDQHAGVTSEVSETMLIPSANAGAILGRAGSKIKKLRQESGAQLRLSTESQRGPAGDGAEKCRLLTISGSNDEVGAAMAAVREILQRRRR